MKKNGIKLHHSYIYYINIELATKYLNKINFVHSIITYKY